MKTKLIICGIFCIFFLVCCENKTPTISIPEKINSTDKIFDIKNLNEFGFKENKEYDVTNLPKALSSYYGWIKNEQDVLKDIEIRFYESHEDALTFGKKDITTEDLIKDLEQEDWDQDLEKPNMETLLSLET
jgi:hypothetical protein